MRMIQAVRYTFMSAALCSTMISASVLAQVPSSVEPGLLQQQSIEPTQEPRATPGAIDVPAAPAQAPAIKGAKDSQFFLGAVDLEGVTAYDPAVFGSLYADRIGQKISLSEAQSIAASITTKYRTDGYILAQAIVPPQDVKNGRLVIRVFEGFVSQVVFQGDNPESSWRSLLQGYGDHIKAERPLTVKTLERYLLLMDDLPGTSARGVIRPSAEIGAADIVVTIEHDKYEASATTDNRGTKFLGRHQHQLTAGANSLLGLYDRTLIRGITTSPTTELRFVDVQHEEQLGYQGTRLNLIGSYILTNPGDVLKPLNIEGESYSFDARVLHPFQRSRKQNFTGRASLSYRNSDTDILNTPLTNDIIAAMRVGYSYDRTDNWNGINLFDMELSQGLGIFGASEPGINRSRVDGEEDFTKVEAEFSRLQTLPRGFSLLTSARGQYSFDPLLAAEEFAIGSVGYGQAYDSAEISGDHGAAFKAELRYGQALDYQYLQSYQLYTYYDIGRVWNKDGLPGTFDHMSLASAGLGVRANMTDWISGYAEVGFPLTRDVASEGDDDPRFFFSLTGRF